MTYAHLKAFIVDQMEMRNFYQPAMLIGMLENGGEVSRSQLAAAFRTQDEGLLHASDSEIRSIIERSPGKVFSGRTTAGWKIAEKGKSGYRLLDFEQYTPDQIAELIELCRNKLVDYRHRLATPTM